MQLGVDALTLEIAETARQIDRRTWQQIGEALGVSRQAAQERYTHQTK